jgi:hypothetical protein
MLNKKEVLVYTKRLDKLATTIQENYQEMGFTKDAAYDVCLQLDTISDRLEKLLGVDKKAVVLEGDPDEAHYMNQFNVGGVIDGMGDEDEAHYMSHYDDYVHHQFSMPLEGESAEELIGPRGRKTASTDYWDDTPKRASATDYWSDAPSAPSRKASTGYWND